MGIFLFEVSRNILNPIECDAVVQKIIKYVYWEYDHILKYFGGDYKFYSWRCNYIRIYFKRKNVPKWIDIELQRICLNLYRFPGVKSLSFPSDRFKLLKEEIDEQYFYTVINPQK